MAAYEAFISDLTHDRPASLNLLGACDVRALISRGEITSEQLVRDCLTRIEARNPEIDAWAYLDPDLALGQALACDRKPPQGLLHGIPVAIKDIYDTADMPTAYGSVVHRHHQPDADSEWVATLRAAGAVILGKTRTTEFANPFPTTTRNPHDLGRTPGVSSSGSVAAIADFMVPLATGSQTGGSVIRPAALCGVYGFKPSFGALPNAGVRHAKPSIDTPGMFARTLDDIALMYAASRTEAPASLALPDGVQPRVGICRTDQWSQALPETVAIIEMTAATLTDAGATVRDVALPDEITAAMQEFWAIVVTEDSRSIAPEARDHFDLLNPWSQKIVREAGDYSAGQYEHARTAAARARTRYDLLFNDYDILITPSARGEAPTDLTAIEPSYFNSVWTLMYAPCVSLPVFTGPAGMPVGLQIVGRRDADNRTLAFARWVEACIEQAYGAIPAQAIMGR